MNAPIGTDGWDGTAHPGDRFLLSASSAASKTLASPGLTFWKLKGSAAWTVDNLETLPTFLDALGRDEMVKMLAGAWAHTPEGMLPAYEVGNIVHDHLDARLSGTPVPTIPDANAAQVMPFIEQVEMFLAAYMPEAIATEQCVFSPEDGVAGRFDAKVRFPHIPSLPGVTLLDLKTAAEPKKVYADSHGLQLTAYRFATHQATFNPRIIQNRDARSYLASDAELAACVAPEPVDHTCILQVTPTSHRLVPIITNDTTRAYLRSVVNAFRWAHGVAGGLVGADIAPAVVPA